MRSLGATALLVLATLSECLGAQSDRSRSRSPARNAPVASKREVDFDCPEEFGYYPHPTDCTLYYVCVFGGALLESCTGGLMYSHELQTCDWPRNVGCDGTSAIGGDELERLSERDPPPPPPPPRRAPPPPPRAQPNPVITSRGQPKFNRQEYEKQQQLYAEVDDLPPVEELESDRQQRVYRGQPPTIGQVQKDRDGYAAQPINSGRTLNSNIIPASLSQTSKLGSFSFGSQVDDRRTVTPAPQSYNDDDSDTVTDSLLDRQLDIETNEIDTDDVIEKHLRVKRDVVENNNSSANKTDTGNYEISNKNDSGEEIEYVENEDGEIDSDTQDESERGKRQVRYYLKNGYKTNGKTWTLAKPVKNVDLRRPTSSNRPQQSTANYNRNIFFETSLRPNNYYSTANPFLAYQIENAPSQSPFKPSYPDPSNQHLSSPTHIITKSPPISAMTNNDFSTLAGGFYNNVPNNNRFINQPSLNIDVNRPVNQFSFHDSSQLPSSVVTGKPVRAQSHRHKQQQHVEDNTNGQQSQKLAKPVNTKNPPNKSKDYDEESNYSEENSSEESEEGNDDDFQPEYPNFKYPSNKFKDIVNPFANPDFDFDSYLYKISGGDYPSASADDDDDYSNENSQTIRKPVPVISSTLKPPVASQQRLPSSTVNYEGMSTPKPFMYPSGPGSTIAPFVSSTSSPKNLQYERLNVGLVSTILPPSNNNGQHAQRNTNYNVISTPKNQFPSTTALPVASSIGPSISPLQQRPQFEAAFLRLGSTVSPDHSMRFLEHKPQLDASREIVATSASVQSTQNPSFAPYKQRNQNEQNRHNEMPSFKPNSQYEQFLALSPNVALSTGSSTRPTMIEAKPNEHYKQFSSSTANPYSQNSFHSTANYNQFQQSLHQPGSTKVPEVLIRPSLATQKQMEYEKHIQSTGQTLYQQQNGQNNNLRPSQPTAGVSYESVRPKIKPPNFNDDRQLPISYSFLQPTAISAKPNANGKVQIQQVVSVTGKPYNIYVTGTNSPLIVSSPKQQQLNIISDAPYFVSTGKPYSISSAKPYHEYAIVQQTTPKSLTTLANEQLAALRQFWGPTQSPVPQSISLKPAVPSNIPKLENLFSHIIQSTQGPYKNESNFVNIGNIIKSSSTTKAPPKRRPIPKPSPEMNDYYYDDDDEYYNEPAVKPKYMPSTEVKPQRPVVAQNYKEYDDSYEDSDEEDEHSVNITPSQATRLPVGFSTRKPESITKNHNDVSIITKSPLKNPYKNDREKIPVPVLVDYISSTSTSVSPQPSAFKLVPHDTRNKTFLLRKPVTEGPNTPRPPKYLNQTTLRPYTVRHRLAKPTTVNEPSEEDKQTRGKARHPNIVAQILSTTPRDSYKQETRYTKTKHDDTSNSLEPTESVSPASYSASPRPKVLYNGTQNYSPDQYDPFYAVYDEDGELYKDADYVQQYNTASLRPAVQQTYRGTPPPARRPVETYTPRPLPEDYDDELIQGQISNQNQYQAPIRHSTRGEGNELGYDHNPSTVKTTFYEVTTKSTTPPTTSTSTTTTTKRPTTAPYTEAMTPPRNTPRSPTDENPNPESSSIKPDESISPVPSTPVPTINLSAFAKPFEKTDNSHRLEETILPTKRQKISRRPSQVTNNSVELVRAKLPRNEKKVLSLTSGFSIRRNLNNTNNPYTLTVRTHPFEDYNKSRESNQRQGTRRRVQSDNYDYGSSSSESSVEPVVYKTHYERSSERPARRKDFISNIEDDYDIPIYVKPTSRTKIPESKPAIITTTTTVKPTSESINLNILTDRALPLITTKQNVIDFTENSINRPIDSVNNFNSDDNVDDEEDIPVAISPYKSLDNLRNKYRIEDTFYDRSLETSSPTPQFKTTSRKPIRIRNPNKGSRSKPSYYTYKLEEDDVPDKTTEVFSGKVKTVIKTFLNTFESSTFPEIVEEIPLTTTTAKSTTPLHRNNDEVVNIGYQRKANKYLTENPIRTNVQRLKIITEPSVSQEITPSIDNINLNDQVDLSSMTTTMVSNPFIYANIPTTAMSLPSSTSTNFDSGTLLKSKFIDLITTKPINEISQKFKKILSSVSDSRGLSDEPTKPIEIDETDLNVAIFTEASPPSKLENDVASTTSTTKATTTVRIEPTTTTTKSISFPTRASRVNPAIKLAATYPGSGRRSYQSSSNCSTDNSLQANPKCNEIKYQRPTSTRGRGSAHYSKSSTSDGQQAQSAPNRGTPPTRNRPTLKPSTAIVSETTKFVDIYSHPPNRPAPVYPQPTPDKTAAKCRKDVCLLPDCYCGGKDIPGDLPMEQVPQIVLLTFDDSVNDLNKGLYSDLFEKGRVNPNGCPITATFYVSHEWTDYSQVQNLYAVGHEMASHTVSHSFGEQFSQKKWNREVGGQREILAAYGGVKLEDVRGMRAPFLSVGGNNMFKMLYESNFTYDSSLPVYENKPPSWPYTLDYKIFHDCMIPPCPTKSYPGVWEVPMVMWQDLNGGRCSMGDACANPPEPENVYKMILKNFDRHYTSNRAPFGLFYHAAWFTQPHHKEGFIMFLDFINKLPDVWIVTNWQALQWVRDPTPISRMNNFQPFQCDYQDRPKKCNNPKVCNLWHKSGVRYMRTCQPCPEVYPWTGKSGIRSSRIDNNGE